VRDASGGEAALEGWASSTVTAPLTLQLDDNGGRVYGGAANDMHWEHAA
jgi:hypothetical protein